MILKKRYFGIVLLMLVIGMISVSSVSAISGDGTYEAMTQLGMELPDGTSFKLSPGVITSIVNGNVYNINVPADKNIKMTTGLNKYVKKVNWNFVDYKYVTFKKGDPIIPQSRVKTYTHITGTKTTDSQTFKFPSSGSGRYLVYIDYLDADNTGYWKGFYANVSYSKKAELQPIGITANRDKQGNEYSLVLRIKNTGDADTSYKAKYYGYSAVNIKYSYGKLSYAQTFVLDPIKIGKTKDIVLKYPQVLPSSWREKILRTITLNYQNYIIEHDTANNIINIKS